MCLVLVWLHVCASVVCGARTGARGLYTVGARRLGGILRKLWDAFCLGMEVVNGLRVLSMTGSDLASPIRRSRLNLAARGIQRLPKVLGCESLGCPLHPSPAPRPPPPPPMAATSLMFSMGQAWLRLGGRAQMKVLANAPRLWNMAMRECWLSVHFLSKALKIKLLCLNIYF